MFPKYVTVRTGMKHEQFVLAAATAPSSTIYKRPSILGMANDLRSCSPVTDVADSNSSKYFDDMVCFASFLLLSLDFCLLLVIVSYQSFFRIFMYVPLLILRTGYTTYSTQQYWYERFRLPPPAPLFPRPLANKNCIRRKSVRGPYRPGNYYYGTTFTGYLPVYPAAFGNLTALVVIGDIRCTWPTYAQRLKGCRC